MDGIDREILRLLRQDARRSYTDMASELDLSEGAIRARVKDLVQDGVIERFTIETRGAGLAALVGVAVRVNVEASDVAEQMLGLDGVDRVWELSGETDLMAEVHVDRTEDLNEVIDAVRRTGNVDSTRTSLVLKEHRR